MTEAPGIVTLSWYPEPQLGAVGLLTVPLIPLDAQANPLIAQAFGEFLAGYQAQGAAHPWLAVDLSRPDYVEQRFNLLVHEFKWINRFGGGLAVLNARGAVREAFAECAVADYIAVINGAAIEDALAIAIRRWSTV